MDCPKCKRGLVKHGQDESDVLPEWALFECFRCLTWWLLYGAMLHEISKEGVPPA